MIELGFTVILFAMLGGLALLIADIYAVIQTLKSGSDGLIKIIWIVLIIMMPVVGLILWFIAGPRPANA